MEINIKLTLEEFRFLKTAIEMLRIAYGRRPEETEQLQASVYNKVLFEISKIECPYCESYNFTADQAEKIRKCLECGNEFERS
jgi:DNA-directed RNA polymerase subunit RPC12/RpoP